jgi:dolichol kinase
MGVVSISLYEFVFSRTLILIIGGSLLGLFVLLEVLRRQSEWWNERLYHRMFARLARPREAHRPCTSTWYLSGLMIGVVLFPQHAIELGALVLAFGDPAASLVGKRWGQTKIVGDKSLVGTLAFFVVSVLLCAGFLCWRVTAMPLPDVLLVAAAVSAAGALAELVSTRINDNVSIPLVAGAVATFLL